MLLQRIALSATLALCAAGTQAQTPDLQARAWAASCAACHGTQGQSQGGIPSIAGVDKATLLDKLKAYRDGKLPAAVMHQHAKGYTDAELDRLATHFAAQKR
jgi:cytochrome c553